MTPNKQGSKNALEPLVVKVSAPYACFTRPEMKVERVTYPVMTPSAARGVLNAIFWKPEFLWYIQEIWVLKPIRHISILRNEVNSVLSVQEALKPGKAYFADQDRAQRHTLALRDVAYLIKAQIRVVEGAEKNVYAYRDQFRRRVERGQCYWQPYLGCREFSADFCLPDGTEQPINHSDDLGRMLFDIRYDAKGKPVEPLFFHAYLENGILRVPQELYDTLYKEVPPRPPRNPNQLIHKED